MTANTHHSIRAVQETDTDPIAELWETRFGETDSLSIGNKSLVSIAADSITSCEIYVATDQSNELTGFVVGTTLPASHLENWIAVQPDPFPTATRNGFIQAIAVSPHHEHEGIATELLDRVLTHFTDVGAGEVYAVSWQRENTVDSTGLFEKFDFENLSYIDSFYAYGESPRQDCPDCSTDHCTCDGIIYRKQLNTTCRSRQS